MNQRTKTEIEIRRPYEWSGGTSHYTLTAVPITPAARRKFTLMQEDSITLVFSLTTLKDFRVGDFIEDELFTPGRYILTEEQMPKYNTTTGGYDYTLRFDADYMYWKNYLFTLVSYDSKDTTDKRMEVSWSLTDKLYTHAEQVISNLKLLGIEGWKVNVDNVSTPAEKRNEIKFISYQGSSILDALNTIVNTFECEWWVERDSEGGTICFGKCEISTTDPLQFALGDNLESVDIANNRNTYANRIFAYGGDRNVPDDYDRKLVFNITHEDSYEFNNATVRLFCDDARYIEPDMIEGVSASEAVEMIKTTTKDSASTNTTTKTIIWNSRKSNYGCSAAGAILKGTLKLNIVTNLSSGWTISVKAQVLQEDAVIAELFSDSATQQTPQYVKTFNISEEWDEQLHDISIRVTAEIQYGISSSLTVNTGTLESSVTFKQKGIAMKANLYVADDDTAYPITFNPRQLDSTDDGAKFFRFDDAIPAGFGVGTQYTLDGLDAFNVPLSYYTAIYESGVLSKVGARLIHLPLEDYPNRYIQKGDDVYSCNVVELAVQFPDIYPKMELKIAEGSVTSSVIIDETVYSDGSMERKKEKRYHFKVVQKNGGSFKFNTKYILDGNKLRGEFTAPESMSGEGFKLAGMAFDLGFDNYTQQFTIIRNEDYGMMFPNQYLFPTEGDTLFLTGWNPRAMNDLGLVADAEAKLAEKAQEYLNAIEEGQFTLTCHMMSDYPFQFVAGMQIYTSKGEPIKDAAGMWFLVKNDYKAYSLPIEGTQVTVFYDAAKTKSKTSRIIGYEFKLDMPWDSPTYVIGETQAYSRLAKIEKELTKL